MKTSLLRANRSLAAGCMPKCRARAAVYHFAAAARATERALPGSNTELSLARRAPNAVDNMNQRLEMPQPPSGRNSAPPFDNNSAAYRRLEVAVQQGVLGSADTSDPLSSTPSDSTADSNGWREPATERAQRSPPAAARQSYEPRLPSIQRSLVGSQRSGKP